MATSGTTAEKTRAPHKSRFDIVERERLRAAILRYMKDHRIGAPALQTRIAEGSGRSVDLVPLKTLQRFIGGIGRTNDAFIALCHQFAHALPEGNDPSAFAREFAGFFGLERDDAVPDWLTGEYSVFTEPPKAESDKRIRVLEPGPIKKPTLEERLSFLYAACVFERRGADGPLYLHQERQLPAASAETRHSYEGIVIGFRPLLFAVLRNNLTKLPRAYWLRDVGGGELAGVGMEALFLDNMEAGRPYTPCSDFHFRPVAKDRS
jgi:hypothetical protein